MKLTDYKDQQSRQEIAMFRKTIVFLVVVVVGAIIINLFGG